MSGLVTISREIHLQAGEIYINHLEFTTKLAYIQQGIMRVYAVKDNGDEATLLLRWEDQFIASHEAIILNKPSTFIYQALEPIMLLELDYSIIEEIMHRNPQYEPLRNFVLKSMLGGALQMLEDFVMLSAEERYVKLLAENLDVVNRVPGKHIASMLGITPVSLSRIRQRLARK